MPPPKTTNVEESSPSFGKRNRRGSAASTRGSASSGDASTGSFSNALRGSVNLGRGSINFGSGASARSTRGLPIRQVSTVELEDGTTIAMDLNIVLSNEKYFQYMMRHQQQEYTSENLIFWKAVDKLKREKDYSRERSLALYNTYIKNGVDMQVNISQDEREKIEAVILSKESDDPRSPSEDPESPTIPDSLFNTAQNEVYMMLKGDLYPRFKESAQFKEMLRNEFNVKAEPEPKKRTSIVAILTGSGSSADLSTLKKKEKGSSACSIM